MRYNVCHVFYSLYSQHVSASIAAILRVIFSLQEYRKVQIWLVMLPSEFLYVKHLWGQYWHTSHKPGLGRKTMEEDQVSSKGKSFAEYTGCPRRNVPDFGRVFLMLKYTDITQNTYIQSWTVTEIMAREFSNFDSCYTLIDYQIHIKTGRNMWFL